MTKRFKPFLDCKIELKSELNKQISIDEKQKEKIDYAKLFKAVIKKLNKIGSSFL